MAYVSKLNGADLLLVKDVARALGLGDVRIRQLADEGKIPSVRTVGGVRIFHRKDVEKVARERRGAKK